MASIKEFKGINNVDSAERIEDNELRAAKNINIDRTGRITRKDGYTQIYAGTNVHSVWSNGSIILFVEDGTLKELAEDNTASIIRSDAARFGRMSYVDIGGDIYYTDGAITGIYTRDGNSKPLGLSTPPTRPVLTPIEGVLPAGQYGIAITVADSAGMESGATLSSFIELPNNSGINVAGLGNALAVPDAVTVNIYLTNTDGDVLYRAVSGSGMANVDLTNPPQGEVLRTQFLDAMPAGNHIAYHKGRALIARDNVVYFSEPASFLTRLTQNFIIFPNTVNMVAPVEDGIFISVKDDKTYHIFGTDPDKWAVTEKAEYSAIEGTAVFVDADLLPGDYNEEGWLWLSEKGMCLGTAGGGFQNLTSKKYAVISSTIGAAMLRQTDGRNQYVSAVHPDNGEVNNLYFSDVATAEIRRNGVIIT